jgi:uncharacterized protein YllA (UPF0747 family)
MDFFLEGPDGLNGSHGLNGLNGPEKLETPESRDKIKMKMSWAELKAWLNKQPVDFSPNALLRPVVQDSLLPTVAYVAGPAELAYLGQSQVVYAELERPMPVIFPRAGFTLVDRRVQRTLEKYSLSVEDVWKGEEHLNLKLAAAGASWSEHFAQSERELSGLLARLRDDIQAIDPTLLDLLKHTEEKINYQLERLKGKLSRAALGRSDVLARHQQSLLRFLTPAKDLQERQVSGAYFLGRAGYDLLDRLLVQIQIASSDHQIVVY